MTDPASSERPLIESALAQVRALRSQAASPEPALPELPGYEIRAELERGGQGVVYRGVRRATGQDVAIKFLRDERRSESARLRFEREVGVLARLRHPSLVAIHDCGVHAGRFYYVMDYVPGRDLDEELAAVPRSLREQVELLARVARAVGAAHQRGVLHRDLKPGNIRIDPEGEPHLLDFGLAKWLDGEDGAPALTSTGGFLGSAPWASPEQVDGLPADVRADVYSLGVLAFQALTGAFPYDVSGPLAKTFAAIRASAPARPRALRPEIDSDLETILVTALAKEPERRYASALDLARDLENWLAGRPIDARRDSPLYVLRKQLRRHWIASSTALGVFVLTLAFAASLSRQRELLAATVRELEARLHAEELRQLGEAFERGDGPALEATLATVPAARHDWAVGRYRECLQRRRWSFAPAGELLLAAAFSPDGRRVATGAWDGTLSLLAAEDGRVLWEDREALAEVRALAIEGEHVVALQGSGPAFFELGSGALVRSVEWPEGGLELLSLAPERLLAASVAGAVVEIDPADGAIRGARRCRHPAGAGEPARNVLSGVDLTALHARSGRIATVGQDVLCVWDVDADEPRHVVPLKEIGRSLTPSALAFSDDGARLALGAWTSDRIPGSVLVLDARTGERLEALDDLGYTPGPILPWSTEECLVGANGGALRSIELATGRARLVLPGADRRTVQALFAPGDGELALLGDGLALWSFEPPAARLSFAARALALTPEGERWVGGLEAGVAVLAGPGDLRHEFPATRRAAIGVALDPSANAVIVTAKGGSVVRFSLAEARPVAWELGLSLNAIAAHDGRILCAALEGPLFRLDARTGSAEPAAQGPPGATALALDARRAAVASKAGLTLIELESGRVLFETRLPAKESIAALAFLAGEELLAAGTLEGRVWLVALARGEVLCALPEKPGPVAALAYDAARRELLVAGADGRLDAWRSASYPLR